ncbi:putative glycoside hydrolase [Hydrogenimonas cancrithermarum]|uniref:Uncharacterized protein n=1 Tax=Hydrogenimonas cancrithermarum TaxID=2993563 RepID=A0ABN6WYE9_9BACT|nr:putative glycoside hydrolase [Hydrogenimonas cancrithermarum]BDY13245.1 hypothetical protein HCR_15570 [Hydrogenimonas cancrithermarum]
MKKFLILLLLLAGCGHITTEPSIPETSENFRIGARVTHDLSEPQIEFLNACFYYVMTPLLEEDMRDAIRGPQLILYRSIQGTWEGFDQFDWEHIDSHENMFLHHEGARIQTVWGSWLMNPGDFVDESAPDAMDHWINYYAVTAAEQVYAYGYDGLFVDSASHWLNPSAVDGVMPDDYDLDNWYQDRVDGLAYVKSKLPDRFVVFNGLHNRHGAEDSLANTDGGMWETFAFEPGIGKYRGEEEWSEVLELVMRHPDRFIVLVVKEQPGLTDDVRKRLFSVGSYLLVSGEKVVFSMSDEEHTRTNSLLYYPEYTLDLGAPLGNYTRSENGLYLRSFEKGLVIVNPSETKTLSMMLSSSFMRVVPAGGGEVDEVGGWDGSLSYEPVSGEVSLPPVSALLLVVP